MRNRFDHCGFLACMCAFVCLASPVLAQGFFGELRDRVGAAVEEKKAGSPVVNVRQIPRDSKRSSSDKGVEIEDDAVPLLSLEDLPEPGQGPVSVTEDDFNAFQSLFLKPWQRKEIFDIRNFQGDVYEAYIAELRAEREREAMKEALKSDNEEREQRSEKIKPPEDQRYIHLQGILYSSADEWVVWMNGQKITPEALPREVVGFKVYESYVEMRWFDEYTNKIIPLRLHPMQRFHIDTRMFLPG